MYIIEYIKESQVTYPNISATPYDVMEHLLFTNGNGVDIHDGNFVKIFKYDRKVSFHDYFKDPLSRKDMIKSYDEYNRGDDVNKVFEVKKEMYSRLCKALKDNDSELSFKYDLNDDELYEEAEKDYDRRYYSVDWIDQYTLKDLKSKSFWIDSIKKIKYNPHLSLSKGFFKADHFNEKTDNDLLKVTITLSFALIDVMEELLENKNWTDKKSLFSFKWSDVEIERYTKTYPEDIVMLEKLIAECQSYIK